jgi:hypothetical protein
MEPKNADDLGLVPASDVEMQEAVSAGVAQLMPALDKCARGMFLSLRDLPEQSADMYAVTLALASITATFLSRLQEMLSERGALDITEVYLGVLLPMLSRISPYVVSVTENQAFEEFLNKEMSAPEGALKH